MEITCQRRLTEADSSNEQHGQDCNSHRRLVGVRSGPEYRQDDQDHASHASSNPGTPAGHRLGHGPPGPRSRQAKADQRDDEESKVVGHEQDETNGQQNSTSK